MLCCRGAGISWTAAANEPAPQRQLDAALRVRSGAFPATGMALTDRPTRSCAEGAMGEEGGRGGLRAQE